MLECWNKGLEGLGCLEFRGKRYPLSNSNSELELLFYGEQGTGNRKRERFNVVPFYDRLTLSF